MTTTFDISDQAADLDMGCATWDWLISEGWTGGPVQKIEVLNERLVACTCPVLEDRTGDGPLPTTYRQVVEDGVEQTTVVDFVVSTPPPFLAWEPGPKLKLVPSEPAGVTPLRAAGRAAHPSVRRGPDGAA